MQYIYSVLLAWFFFLLIVLLTQVRVQIHIHRKGKNDKIKTKTTAWFGLIHLETETPIIKLKDDLSGTLYQMEMKSPNHSLDESRFTVTLKESIQMQRRLLNIIKSVHQLHIIMKKFLKTIRLERFEWRSVVGTGDAAETGILSGIGWGVKSSILTLLQVYFTLRSVPRVYVKPSFQESTLETELTCMIRFRIGNAILAGIRMLLNLRKRRDVKWQNTQFKA